MAQIKIQQIFVVVVDFFYTNGSNVTLSSDLDIAIGSLDYKRASSQHGNVCAMNVFKVYT